MAPKTTDRVGELLGGVQRQRRVIVSPEGVPLDIQVAGHGERLTALGLDLAFMLGAILLLYLLLGLAILSRAHIQLGSTAIMFTAFLVRNLYFMHFELAWQGRTPGKKICGLRVINRSGGELTPAAVIARNLTREVEIFLPLDMFLRLLLDSSGAHWAALGWALTFASLPLLNRDHLRAGDLIGGTQVIAMPKRVLLEDLSAVKKAMPSRPAHTFTAGQLGIYGAFELQVLEELLRRPETLETNRLLAEVAGKISRKIKWEGRPPSGDIRGFLIAFYTAERAELERGQLFGRFRDDQQSPAAPPKKTQSKTLARLSRLRPSLTDRRSK